MDRHTLETHDSRPGVVTPDCGTVTLAGLGALAVPLTGTVAFSSPDFGTGILAGLVLPFTVRNVRRLGVRSSRDDPEAVGRAFRPDEMRAKATEPSHADR